MHAVMLEVVLMLSLAVWAETGQVDLPRVSLYAAAPSPFTLMDWHDRAAQLDTFLLSPAARAAGFVWWTCANPSPMLPPGSSTMGIASYANATTFKPGSSER
jgi:hypothetical protein